MSVCQQVLSQTLQESLTQCSAPYRSPVTEWLAADLSAELQRKQTQAYVTPFWPGHGQQDRLHCRLWLQLQTDCTAAHLTISFLSLSLSQSPNRLHCSTSNHILSLSLSLQHMSINIVLFSTCQLWSPSYFPSNLVITWACTGCTGGCWGEDDS